MYTNAMTEHNQPDDAPDTSVDPAADTSKDLDADPAVDTGPLERSQQAIDEGRDAAARALDDSPPNEPDMDFENVETNTDSEASDNAVPRPN